MIDPYTLFVTGNVLGAIAVSFTNIMGAWFYGLILFTVVASIYIRNQDISMATLISVIVGVGMAALVPAEAINIMYIETFMILGVVLYKLFTRG